MLKLLARPKIYPLLRGVVAVILIAVPLFPKFPLLPVPGTFVAIRIEDFLLLIAGLIWFLYILPDLKNFLNDKTNQAIFLFLAILGLSLVSGVFLTQTVVPHIGLLHLLRRIEYFLPFFFGATVIKKEADLSFYIKILILVFYLAFAFGVGQKYLGWPIVTTQNFEYSKGVALRYTPGAHLPSTFAGHYDLASFLILTLPLMFVIFFGQVKLGKAQTKKISLAAILAGFWLLVASISRISFVSYLINISLALFLVRKVKWLPLVLVLSLILAGSSADLVGRYMQIIQVTLEKVVLFTPNPVLAQDSAIKGVVLPAFEDRSTSIRFNVEWPRAFRAFRKNPMLGTGLSSITLATDNDYLRLLGEAGTLGFLAFGLIFIRIFTRLASVFPIPKKLKLRQAYLVGIIAALPGVFLNALFIDIFEASKFAIIFWLLIGMAYAVAKKTD